MPEDPTLPLSAQIIEAVADATDTPPTDLTPPLYNVLDPDALDHLGDSEADLRFTVDYAGARVVATADTVLFATELPQTDADGDDAALGVASD
jgi:hypothetical protein